MTPNTAYPALILNADYTPYDRLSWQDALRALFRGLAHAVSFYDATVSSPSKTFQLPSVMALNRYIDIDRPAAFTRRNLLLAYRQCNLCGEKLPLSDLTFEHVMPTSRGGAARGYFAVTAACFPCNNRKGNRTLAEAGMSLVRPLYHPTERQIIEARFAMEAERPHPEPWSDYLSELYWTVPLDET